MLLAYSNNFTSIMAGKIHNHLKNKTYILLHILSLVLLIPRFNGFDISSGRYLWAEDGAVFINDAQFLGIASLWKPYAGYLLIYPRSIAFLANYVDLTVRPIIFFIGWILSYLLLISVLIRKVEALKNNGLSLLFLIILIALQPNAGECFFNLTNSLWLLGTALCLLCLINDPPNTLFKFKLNMPLNFCLLLLLGLTGPFSVILMPILIVKAIVIRDFRKNIVMYLTLFGCGIIQLIVLLYSPRLLASGIDPNVWDWLIAFLRMILLGSNTFLTLGCALLFWGILIITGSRPATTKTCLEVKIQIFLVFATAILFILAALYSAKNSPLDIAFLGDANRYNWVPNSLIFFVAMVITNDKKIIQFILFVLLLTINYQHFHPTELKNLQFKSFAHFAQYAQVKIPVSPQWPISDSWFIMAKSGEHSLASLEQPSVNWANVSVLGADVNLSTNEFKMTSVSQDPQLILNDSIICKNASDLGIELDVWRSEEGWIQIFWTNESHFQEEKSLRRWYPGERVKAQFALPYTQGGVKIRLDLLEKPGEVKIYQMNIYCLN